MALLLASPAVLVPLCANSVRRQLRLGAAEGAALSVANSASATAEDLLPNTAAGAGLSVAQSFTALTLLGKRSLCTLLLSAETRKLWQLPLLPLP